MQESFKVPERAVREESTINDERVADEASHVARGCYPTRASQKHSELPKPERTTSNERAQPRVSTKNPERAKEFEITKTRER